MLLRNLTTLLLPVFFLFLLTPFSTEATPQDDSFFTATTPQGRHIRVGILPGYHVPTDRNGQVINDWQCKPHAEFVFKRQSMLMAAEGLCSTAHGKILHHGEGAERRLIAYSSIILSQALIIAKIDVAKGLVWEADGDVCNELLRWLIDDCDTHGEDVKCGGVIEISGVTFSLKGRGIEKEEEE